MEHMHQLTASNEQIASRLQESEATNEQLSLQLTEQIRTQKEVADQLSAQEAFQADVLNRLDNQEALTEGISRQLNHIRSIIFERVNYLASKLEDGCKLTSSYVYKLMNGSDQPLTFSSLQDNEEKQLK